jgi:hypothetical protein
LKILHLLVAAGIAMAAAQVSARTPVPIVNHENVPAQKGSGSTASAEELKRAVMAAASSRNWMVSEPTPGRLVATYHVRGKHTIVTEIRYKAGNFSVTYHDSINMKYSPSGPTGAGPVIHPSYNSWVQDFLHAVRLELAKV